MKKINLDWIKSLTEDNQKKLHENVISVTDDIEIKGRMFYNQLEKRIKDFLEKTGSCRINYSLKDALEHCITKEVCQYVSYDTLYRLVFKDEEYPVSDEGTYQFVKNLYMRYLGVTDEHTLEIAEKYKMSGSFRYSAFNGNVWYTLSPLWPRYMTIEDKAVFQKRKKREAIKEQKQKAEEKFKEENPPMTSQQVKAFKLALKQQTAEQNTATTADDIIQSHKPSVDSRKQKR